MVVDSFHDICLKLFNHRRDREPGAKPHFGGGTVVVRTSGNLRDRYLRALPKVH